MAASGTGVCNSNQTPLFPAYMDEVFDVTCASAKTGGTSGSVCRTEEVAGVWEPDVPANGRYPEDIWTFGGSSSCVSTVSGIAALVWSRHEDWSAEQVRIRLRESAHLYPNFDYWIGYGVVDAFRAVGGAGTFAIDGPSVVDAASTYGIRHIKSWGDGPVFRYEWTDGACDGRCQWNGSTCTGPCGLVGECANGQLQPYCSAITRTAPSEPGAIQSTSLVVIDESSVDQRDAIAVRVAGKLDVCARRTCAGLSSGLYDDGCGGQVTCVNDSQFLSQISPPSKIALGSTASVSVVFRNTGSATWKSVDGYRLGSQNPQDNTNWGFGRVELPVSAVEPQKDVTFNFTVTAPTTDGIYGFQWKMVRDGVEWFGQATTNVDVEVGCVPKDCGSMICGTADDGCGGTISCGSCPSGYTCSADQTVCLCSNCSEL